MEKKCIGFGLACVLIFLPRVAVPNERFDVDVLNRRNDVVQTPRVRMIESSIEYNVGLASVAMAGLTGVSARSRVLASSLALNIGHFSVDVSGIGWAPGVSAWFRFAASVGVSPRPSSLGAPRYIHNTADDFASYLENLYLDNHDSYFSVMSLPPVISLLFKPDIVEIVHNRLILSAFLGPSFQVNPGRAFLIPSGITWGAAFQGTIFPSGAYAVQWNVKAHVNTDLLGYTGLYAVWGSREYLYESIQVARMTSFIGLFLGLQVNATENVRPDMFGVVRRRTIFWR